MTDPWKDMGAKVLRGVAELFAQPGTWTQDAWARDAGGLPLTRALDSDAVRWCLRGAIRKVAGPGCTAAEKEAVAAVRIVLRLQTNDPIAAWNDDPRRCVADVILLVTRAAANLEGAQ